MNLTKKDDIVKDGTEVLTGKNSKNFIAKIYGNDCENCNITKNGEYIDLNYYVVENGKTFNEENMCLIDEFIVLGTKKSCPNCGKIIEEDLKLKTDELGNHSNCPKCGLLADIEMFYEK